MVIAADYPFMDVMWSMFIFFAWVIFIMILITLFSDVFKRHDMGGLAKTFWIIFMIGLPFLGVFIYLIAYSKSMSERNMAEAQQSQEEIDAYIRTVSSKAVSPTEEMARAKELLDSGTINQAEFDSIKAKTLAS